LWVRTQFSSSHTTRSGSKPAHAWQGFSGTSPTRGGSGAGGRSAFGAIFPSTTSHGKMSHSAEGGIGRWPSFPTAATTRA
jgi:hypothetical protein